MLICLTGTISAASEIVIDNADSGFSTTGSWTTSSYSTGFYGSDYLYANSGLFNSVDTATWRPNIQTAGEYEVWVYFSTNSTRDQTVPYTVSHAKGQSEFVLDQRKNPGWNLLGKFEFAAGNSGFVQVKSSGFNYTAADSAKFVPVASGKDVPYWKENNFTLPDAQLSVNYSTSIADKAVNPNNEVMTFTMSPSNGWLHMDQSGNLYGVPNQTGVYTYTVSVAGSSHPDNPETTIMTITVSDGTTPPPPAPSCLDGITNYVDKGPFSYDTKTYGSVKMWVPRVPNGCKVPVIHLANGTGATCSTYGGTLQHLASHGFLATCYENANTGAGTQCIDAVKEALTRYPNLTDNKLGFTGHSQGGGAAFICTYRAEQEWGNSMKIAGHAIEPASGFGSAPLNWSSMYSQITSPMFMFNGSIDTLVSASYVRQAFNALNGDVEAYWYEANGAAHIPIPTAWSKESAAVWFRWKLLGDKAACQYFKAMPGTSDWDSQDSQNEQQCN
jgi:hypothetical protein